MKNSVDEQKDSTVAEPGQLRRLADAGLRWCVIGVPLAGLLTLFAGDFWLSELLANLRLQLMIAGGVLLIVTALVRQWKLCGVQALMIIMHLTWLSAPEARATVTSDTPSLTVTAVNVYLHNREFDRIATMLRETDADVIMVTELTPKLHGFLENALADTHPHVAAQPALGAFGVAIYSRHPLSDSELIGAPRAGSTLLATVDTGEQAYRVAAVHPVSPMTPSRFTLRNDHLDALSRAVRITERDDPDLPLITMGDFNLTPWSPHFRRFQRTSGLQHVVTGSGVEPTWYARGLTAFPVGLVLDHCLVSPGLSCVSHRIGPSVASDHLPITVQLSYDADGRQAPKSEMTPASEVSSAAKSTALNLH